MIAASVINLRSDIQQFIDQNQDAFTPNSQARINRHFAGLQEEDFKRQFCEGNKPGLRALINSLQRNGLMIVKNSNDTEKKIRAFINSLCKMP
jgi:hypothetical protein